MSDITKKKPIAQAKTKRERQIEAMRIQWAKDAEELAKQKEALGYKDRTWEAFMAIVPTDACSETTAQSSIIELQEKYKNLTEQQQALWAEDNVIDELNKKHAVVRIDQTYILTEKNNAFGDQDFSLEGRQSFKMFYEDEVIMCVDGIERCKADIWLKSSQRRKFNGIIFDPKTIKHTDGYYNLWKGFAVDPAPGSAEKYWQHAKENICNGNEEDYQYLRKWVAYIFQHPHIVHTALVLCGSQGVGKNSFVEPLGHLLGQHFAPLSNISELVSNFNYHLKNAVLIHANEALWGGHKKDLGTVKAMITDPACYIEGKGKDRIRIKNYRHVILSSNEDWPVHLDADDRRFFVLYVSDKCKENHEYFRAIKKELEGGGYEALLHDLLHEDLASFDPRLLPANANSFEIKMRSADSAHRYVYAVLNEVGFPIAKVSASSLPVWQSEIPKDSVYEDYAEWCKNSGEETLTKSLFGKALKKLIVSIEDKRPSKGGSRVWCYKFPSLQQACKDFSKAFREKPERIFGDYEDDVPAPTQAEIFPKVSQDGHCLGGPYSPSCLN